MANKKLINKFKYMYQQIQNITPLVYAAIALALHRECGWGYTRINRVFALSQEIWIESEERGMDMIEMCKEETGIELQARRD